VRLLNRGVLATFALEHAEIRGALSAWEAEVRRAEWETPADIKTRFPLASLLRANRVVFNVKGQKYRVDVTVDYATRIVFVNRVGTHAEYNTWKF
jgi:mRNA interferase HigB